MSHIRLDEAVELSGQAQRHLGGQFGASAAVRHGEDLALVVRARQQVAAVIGDDDVDFAELPRQKPLYLGLQLVKASAGARGDDYRLPFGQLQALQLDRDRRCRPC